MTPLASDGCEGRVWRLALSDAAAWFAV